MFPHFANQNVSAYALCAIYIFHGKCLLVSVILFIIVCSCLYCNQNPVISFIKVISSLFLSGLEPYSLYEAKGNSILHKIRRSDLYETDIYFFHAVVTSDSTPDVVLLTNKYVVVRGSGTCVYRSS